MGYAEEKGEDLAEKEAADGITRDAATGDYTYRQGKWWPATILMVAPFAIIAKFVYNAVKDQINWTATILTIALFEVVMFPAEMFAVGRGHWVWNESRILGWKIAGVPIEEPLLYYWFGPFFVILSMLFIQHLLAKRLNK